MVAYWKHWKLLLMFSNLTQPEGNKTSASYQVLPKQMCDLWKLASADVISHIFLCQLAKRNQISKYCFLIGCHSNMNWFVTHWHTKTEWLLTLSLLYKFSLFIKDRNWLFKDWCKKTWQFKYTLNQIQCLNHDCFWCFDFNQECWAFRLFICICVHFKGKPNLTSLSENPAKTRKLSLKFHTIQMSCLESTILLKNFSCDFSLPVTTYEM